MLKGSTPGSRHHADRSWPALRVVARGPGSAVGVLRLLRARLLLEVSDISACPSSAPPRRLRGPRARHPTLRQLDPRRAPTPRQQGPQTHLFLSPSIPPAAPTTTASALRASATTPPSSAWPDAAWTSCSPCSATAASTRPPSPKPLDRRHRDTPPHLALPLRFALSPYHQGLRKLGHASERRLQQACSPGERCR